MVSLPQFNLGQGSQQSFLSTPLNPQASNPAGAAHFSSTPFPSSSVPQQLGINLSGLGGQTAGTNQPLGTLGAPTARTQGMSIGLTAPATQRHTQGNPITQFQGLGIPNTQFQGSGIPNTQFQGSGIPNTQFQGLGIPNTQFQGSGIPNTQFQGSGIPNTQFQGSGIPNTQFQGSGILGTPTPKSQLGTTANQLISGQGIMGGLLGQSGTGQPTQLGGASTQPLGVNLGSIGTSQTAGLNVSGSTGLGIAKYTSQPQLLNLAVSPARPLGATSAPTSLQAPQSQVLTLGGALPQSGGSATQQQALPNDVKDLEIDPVLDQLSKNLSAYIKQQKGVQDELRKMEMRSLQSCEREHKVLSRSLGEWKRGVSEYSGQVSSLKEDSLQDICVAEVAQRTHELPASLQGEHTDPKLYFQMLAGHFSEKLTQYQQVVEELTKNFSQFDSQDKTPQEVSETFKLLNDIFISLAATIYSLHTRVTQLKDNVIAYSSIYAKDTQLHFPKRIPSTSSSTGSSGELKSGPTPFSLSEASLLSQKYSGGFGTDMYLQTSSHSLKPLQSNLPIQRLPALSLGNKPQDLSSTHTATPTKFTSFLPGQFHTPQMKTQPPAFTLPFAPQPASTASLLAPVANSPVHYPQGFSPLRRGSISGESEESKRKK